MVEVWRGCSDLRMTPSGCAASPAIEKAAKTAAWFHVAEVFFVGTWKLCCCVCNWAVAAWQEKGRGQAVVMKKLQAGCRIWNPDFLTDHEATSTGLRNIWVLHLVSVRVCLQGASKFTKDTEATVMEMTALKVAKKAAKKQAKASVPVVHKVNVRKRR
jgi:hypothetical protein